MSCLITLEAYQMRISLAHLRLTAFSELLLLLLLQYTYHCQSNNKPNANHATGDDIKYVAASRKAALQ